MKVPAKLVTREEAQALGLTYYYTGHPCKHGHYARRYRSSGGCVECGNKFESGPAQGQFPNVHRLSRAIPFSAGDFPNAMDFNDVEQLLIDMAEQAWQAVKKRRGEPRYPRETWPADIRMQLIEGHICYWMGHGEYWLPMYPDAVQADPRATGYAGHVLDEYFDGGLLWTPSHMKWMVHSSTRGEIGPFMK